MDPVKDLALLLVNDLIGEDFKKIKSHIGLLELACDITEETTMRLKKSNLKITPEYKKELAIILSHYILAKLVDSNLIDEGIAGDIEELLNTDSLEKISNIIDDIINIWNDAKTMTINLCYCLGKNKKRVVRKFEHLQPKDMASRLHITSV
mgnify:CR=1 FL=1